MRKKRILLGSCGGLTGLYLAKHFKKILKDTFEIAGFDSEDKNPTKFFLDNFFIIPNSSNTDAFLNNLISLLNDQKIDYYLPLHSREIRTVSEFEDKIKNSSETKFIVSPFQTFLSLDNKRNLYKNFNKIGLKVPKVYEKNNLPLPQNFPIFFKPEVGSGSKGAMILNTKEEFELLKNQNGLFLELINGTEYTVDAIFDLKGGLLGYNQRIRIKTLGGAAVITQNNYEVDISPFLKKIADNYKIKGPCNFQFFRTNDNDIVFTDVNLRFASGGLPLSVASGLDIPNLTLKLLMGEKIESYECVVDKKPRIMYRYFNEIFEEW